MKIIHWKWLVAIICIGFLLSKGNFCYADTETDRLIDACTGEYLDGIDPALYGISLFRASNYPGAYLNEVDHFIESLTDENGNSYVISPIDEPAELPDYVDNTAPFVNKKTNRTFVPFPPIETQGELGSCLAFTATYYQFTHEVNLMNGIDSSYIGNQYSTAYTYNYLNHPTEKITRSNVGGTGAIFDYLTERGCVKRTELPYITYYQKTDKDIENEINIRNAEIDEINKQIGDVSQYKPHITSLSNEQLSQLHLKANTERWFDFNSLSDAIIAHDAIRKALETRVDSWYAYHVKNTGGEDGLIEGPDSEKLTDIKRLLARGKVLMGHLYIGWQDTLENPGYVDPKYRRYAEKDTDLYKQDNREFIICQLRKRDINGKTFPGHSATIVGYDDNIWVDLNGDNIAQAAEKGAFKVVNSWGKDNEMATFWVLYDALNPESALEHNDVWLSLGNDRAGAFGAPYNGVYYNRLFYINVANKSVKVVAGVSSYLSHRSLASVSIRATVYNENGTQEKTYSKELVQRNNGRAPLLEVSYFDISSLIDPSDITKRIKWEIQIKKDDYQLEEGDQKWTISPTISKVGFNLRDNLGNILVDEVYYPDGFDATGNKRISLYTDFLDKDIDLDGSITNSDLELIDDYLNNSVLLSDLQIYLADMDHDGKVTQYDREIYLRWYMENR